jgi:coenzyme F420-reducing hydrogenase delta subunit
VNAALCANCGICVGACPSSTPFQRTTDLATGIDLPDFPLRELLEQVRRTASGLAGPARVLVLACKHGAGSGQRADTVELPCVAMVPPPLLDYVLSRNLADGVAIAGCAERACYHRLGVAWTQERFAGQRDPHLRARVPRERLTTIWASPTERARFAAELAEFAKAVAALPSGPTQTKTPPTHQSGAAKPARGLEAVP